MPSATHHDAASARVRHEFVFNGHSPCSVRLHADEKKGFSILRGVPYLKAATSAESASGIERLPSRRGPQCSTILSRQPAPHIPI